MHRSLAILASFLLVSCGNSGSGPVGSADVGCSCAAPQIVLVLCAAGFPQLDSIGTTGSCRANGFQVEVLQKEGLCRIVLQFKDGFRYEVETTVSKVEGCCSGYYPAPPMFVAKIHTRPVARATEDAEAAGEFVQARGLLRGRHSAQLKLPTPSTGSQPRPTRPRAPTSRPPTPSPPTSSG